MSEWDIIKKNAKEILNGWVGKTQREREGGGFEKRMGRRLNKGRGEKWMDEKMHKTKRKRVITWLGEQATTRKGERMR